VKVTNEIRIRLVNGKDTNVGDEETLFVMSSDDRRHAVSLRIAGWEKVITVDASELRSAIDNAVNLGGAL
jgi:hypothetical protein